MIRGSVCGKLTRTNFIYPRFLACAWKYLVSINRLDWLFRRFNLLQHFCVQGFSCLNRGCFWHEHPSKYATYLARLLQRLANCSLLVVGFPIFGGTMFMSPLHTTMIAVNCALTCVLPPVYVSYVCIGLVIPSKNVGVYRGYEVYTEGFQVMKYF